MTMEEFWSKDVKSLQAYLRARNVTIAHQNKTSLVDLCEGARLLNIEEDPDGLIENREEVINKKLEISPNHYLTNPETEITLNNLLILPGIGTVDTINYMLSFDEYPYSSVRDLSNTEGYFLFKDGFVIDVSCSEFSQFPGYFCIKSHVKPLQRTRIP